MFIPLLRRNADPVQTSLVVPLRGSTMRDDGALSDPERWAEELTTGGRLANLVSFVDSADPGSVTWLVDPAVIDAARRLADGNPGRNIRPTKQPTDQGEADEEADGDAGGSTGGESDAELDPGAQAAADWLGDLPDSLFRQAVLSLPYGDLDVAAAAQYLPSLYERARALSDRTLAGLDVQSAPAIAPPSGHINETGLQLVSDAELLLSEEALPEDLLDDAGPPAAVTTSGRLARMYDPEISAAASGRTATLPLRQRILAEAAVRSLAGGTRQLLVSLPYDFDPGSGGPGFFEGLDQDFVSLVGVDPATEEDVPDVEQLVYTQFQAERELDQTGFDVVSELIRAGESLDRLLPENDQIARDLLAEALSTTSYLVRDVPLSATFDATDALDWVRSLLEKVTIEAPEFVILSARSGPFAVTVDNGLDQPVSLQIRYTRNSQLVIRAPDEIVLPADSQQAVNLEARARSIGVHSVRLLVTDDKGRPLGDEVEVSIRSNQVGRIIWVVMGAGVGILFLAIAVRLVRRVRGARAA